MSMHRDSDIAEQLSALVDGELEPDRARFLLRRLAGDPELRSAWERLHLARSCIGQREVGLARPGFAAAVAAAIDAERATPATRPHAAVRAARWVGGAAVAASVALAALIVIAPAPQETGMPVAATSPQPEARVAPSPVRASDLRPSVMAQTASAALHAGRDGGLAPNLSAQPLYVPSYLVQYGSGEQAVLLRRDHQGGWVLREPVRTGSADEDAQ